MWIPAPEFKIVKAKSPQKFDKQREFDKSLSVLTKCMLKKKSTQKFDKNI